MQSFSETRKLGPWFAVVLLVAVSWGCQRQEQAIRLGTHDLPQTSWLRQDPHALQGFLESVTEAMDITAANLANADTPGYKRVRVRFTNGGRALSLVRDFSQGKLTNTGNPFHVAISGPGFFQVMASTGDTAYTRNGSFQIDQEANLVTHDGRLLRPSIKIAPDAMDIEISSGGDVRVIRSDGIEVVGHLQIFIFPNEQGLRVLNDTLFVSTTASGSPLAGAPLHGPAVSFHGGFLESSNVVATTEDMRLFQLKQWYSAIMAKVSGSSERQVVQALAAKKP